MEYKVLPDKTKIEVLKSRLMNLEHEHYMLGLRLDSPMPGADPRHDGETYNRLTQHVEALQTELEGLESSVAEKSPLSKT